MDSSLKGLVVPELFRRQVVERQGDRLNGEVLILPRFSHSLILGFLLVWIFALFVWLCTSGYARKEAVRGWLEPSSGVVRVYPERVGTIKKVLVHEGELVSEGQPLLIVNGDRVLEGGEHLESILLREYESQKSLLTGQLERSEKIYFQQRADIDRRITSSRRDLALLKKQILMQNERYNLIDEQAKRYRSLHNMGYISSAEMDAVIAQELELDGEKKSVERTQVNLIDQIQRLETEKSLLPEEYANNKAQLRTRLSDLAQQIAQLNGQRAYVVKATKSGVVSNLQVQEGQKAQLNTPAMTIVPNSQELTAQLLVPVRSAGFVKAEQRLNIRYEAFPYQKFGLYVGSVVEVSDAVFLPDELLHSPVVVHEPVFRVTAKLAQPSVNANGKQFPLKAGMTLSADIQLSERTLLQWLLEPILSLKGRL